MKVQVGRFLSELLIDDLRGVDFVTRYGDRLTRTEAQKILEWGKAQPEVRAAFVDKRNPAHRHVALFAGMLNHFADDHPQAGDGEPAAWPERAPSPRAATAENPFADMHEDEAAALLAYAEGHPKYQAKYLDPGHAEHGDMVGKTAALMQIAHPDSAAPRIDAGAPPATSEEGSTMPKTIDELMRAPAYLDRRDPGHKAAVGAVARAYRSGAAGATPIAASAASVLPQQEVAARYADKNFMARYSNKHDPRHGEAVAEMSRLFAAAYPAPPAADAGAAFDQAREGVGVRALPNGSGGG